MTNSLYRQWQLTEAETDKLIEHMLACKSIKKHDIRDTVFQKLPELIYNAIEVHSDSRVHVSNAVKTCLDYRGGMEALIETMCYFENNTWNEQNLLKLLQNITMQPITWIEIIALKRIFSKQVISDKQTREIYRQLPDKPAIHDDYREGELFTCLLEFLAQKPCSPPDKATLLEFLERCDSLITDANARKELDNWKSQVAQRLGIKLNAIGGKINKTPPQTITKPILLIKIEPLLDDEEKFQVAAWLFDAHTEYDLVFQTELGQNYTREALEELIPNKILTPVVKQLGAKKEELFVEIMLPLQLFDWNMNNISIRIGKIAYPLGTCYRFAIRSWDRFYNDEFIHAEALNRKWEIAVQEIDHQSVYQVPEKSFPQTPFNLEASLVFVTRKSVTGG